MLNFIIIFLLFCLDRWGFLEVYTGPGYTDEEQAYAAGFVEGSPPELGEPNMITMHVQNTLGKFPGHVIVSQMQKQNQADSFNRMNFCDRKI